MHLAVIMRHRITHLVELRTLTLVAANSTSVSQHESETRTLGKAHQKSIIRQTIERFDEKMAIGQSRRAAKAAVRAEQGSVWSVSTGKIHSYKTRSVYQEQVLRFVDWVRDTHHLFSLEQLDPRADDLTVAYLQQLLSEGKSPYTLLTIRSALRLFFGERLLAETLSLPRRERAGVTRSRGPMSHDRHFQPANWQPLLNFLRATGLRRQELRDLKCGDIYHDHEGRACVHVESGKGGRMREVQALAGHDDDVWSMKEGRAEGDKVFTRIPKHLDVHSYRREFAQALYLAHASHGRLPPTSGRLREQDYDREAAFLVTQALGHNRLEVALRHYLR